MSLRVGTLSRKVFANTVRGRGGGLRGRGDRDGVAGSGSTLGFLGGAVMARGSRGACRLFQFGGGCFAWGGSRFPGHEHNAWDLLGPEAPDGQREREGCSRRKKPGSIPCEYDSRKRNGGRASGRKENEISKVEGEKEYVKEKLQEPAGDFGGF